MISMPAPQTKPNLYSNFNITTNTKTKLTNTHEKSSPMKNSHHNVCLPNLLMRNKASSTKSGNNKPITSPTSLLDRLREAMLRLIMVTAVSKSASSSHSNRQDSSLTQSYSSPSVRNDPHHSQAVAECIEFIKMSSVYGDCVLDDDLESIHSESSGTDLTSPMVDESHHLVIPSSVM